MKKIVMGIVFLVGMLSFMACSEIDIQSPPGPDGKDAYQVWVEAVSGGQIEWTQGTDLANYFKYLKGEKGDTGESAYVTWKAYIASDTVSNPHNPDEKWPKGDNSEADFFRFLTGADGEDGLTPTINDDGYWEIGGVETGIRAKADSVYVGDDGYWYINDTTTNVRATGDSAYEIWAAEVDEDRITDINGDLWDKDYTTLQDFWNYLQGKLPDGTTPIVVEEITPLELIEAVRSDEVEIFTFQTDSAATVTMSYEGTTVTATADDQGICQISFPNSETREFYVAVTAKAPGKERSYTMSVRVPIRASGYDLAIDWDEAMWCEPGHPGEFFKLDNSGGEYGYIDSTSNPSYEKSPFIWFWRANPAFIVVPFSTVNIKTLKINMTTGLGQFYVSTVIAAPWGDGITYEEGVLVISTTQYSGIVGNDFYEVVAYTNQDIPVLTLTFAATNR